MNYADYYSGSGGGGYQPQQQTYGRPIVPYGQHPYQQGKQYGQHSYIGRRGMGQSNFRWNQNRPGYGYRPMGGGRQGQEQPSYGPSVEGGKDRVPYYPDWPHRPEYGRGMPPDQLRYKTAGQTGPVMPYDPYQGGNVPYGGYQPQPAQGPMPYLDFMAQYRPGQPAYSYYSGTYNPWTY